MRLLEDSVHSLGDRAFSLTWSAEAAPSFSRMSAVARSISDMAFPWLQETVPAYRTLTVHLKSAAIALEDAAAELLRALRRLPESEPSSSRLVRLPVKYGGEEGPDLAECASRSGMTEKRFAELHSAAEYEVAMIGFAPGFPYLSGLPEALAQPRRESPRLLVPAGTVGIAGGQTGIYPVASPGGWQTIGRTQERLFRPQEPRPFLLAPGDKVKFVPVEDLESPRDREAPADAIRTDTIQHSGENSLEVVKPGLLTTVQDLGRPGWQAYGVSVGGAMDGVSMRTANLLVGNREDAAVLEMTLIGAAFSVLRETLVAVCGADMQAAADGEPLPMNRPVWLAAGTTIAFGRAGDGCRAYLAIAGGIDVPAVLGSRSADPRASIGGTEGRALAAGDMLRAGRISEASRLIAAYARSRAPNGNGSWGSVDWQAGEILPRARGKKPRVVAVRVLAGAEWEQFAPGTRRILLTEAYKVELASDRMGIRLSGPALARTETAELASHGVAPGTIQVPANGQPIVLAAGCQPTGGYPKIAHVVSADLPLLAQAAPGDRIAFARTDGRSARGAARDQERDLAILKAGLFALTRKLAAEGAL